MIKPVEHTGTVAGGRRVDPEAQAGRALRRLRLARSWSQEEVAVRMTAYGYDFHQTTIAKIEAAQRPLRVRELADFAALYSVEVQDLVYPPTRSLPEIDQEIADVTGRLGRAQSNAAAARELLDSARKAAHDAEAAYQVAVADVAALEGRLASLSADREKLVGRASGKDPQRAEDSAKTGRNAIDPEAIPVPSVTRGGPTVLRVILGAHLRRLREQAGVTREDAGYQIRASGSKISRLELGRIGFKDRDIVDLLDLYGVTDEKERQKLRDLGREANSPGWWHDYSDILPSWFEVYIGLEMAATSMRIYEAQYVPGLLQTADYSRVVTSREHEDVSAAEIERRVRLRTARQAKSLDRSDPPRLWVILDELVLRREVGGPTVMRDQLNHLAEVAEQDNVTIQVLPWQSSGNSVGGSSFTILRFPEPDLPDIVYLEQLTGALYLDKPDEVEIYLLAMDRLAAQALPPQKTVQFLQRLLK
jgi:transcriptional regulator with XRE-family HTH domain